MDRVKTSPNHALKFPKGKIGLKHHMLSKNPYLERSCSFNPVSNKWDKRGEVPLISIFDSFVELLCNNIEETLWLYQHIMELKFFSLVVVTNFDKKIINSSQNIFFHSLMPKNLMLVIFGIITGLKMCWFSNMSRTLIEWGNHIKSFNTLSQPMLNYCRKFEDVKFNIFEDATL